MRAALYARVSTEEQVEGYSQDAQRRAFQALVQGRGWTVYREYLEEGKSAHTDDIRKRPVFQQATQDALAGKYDVLVVHKIDRFSRKLRITLEYLDKLGRAGLGFVSIQPLAVLQARREHKSLVAKALDSRLRGKDERGVGVSFP